MEISSLLYPSALAIFVIIYAIWSRASSGYAGMFERFALMIIPIWSLIGNIIMKSLFIFLIVCASAGIVAFLGSVIGGVIGQTPLFIGGTVGGLIGVWIGGWIAQRLRLIKEIEFKPTIIGGCIGFIIATVIALNNLHTPVIPLLSTGLTGIGSLIAVSVQRKRLH
jgi:hypothetical protein